MVFSMNFARKLVLKHLIFLLFTALVVACSSTHHQQSEDSSKENSSYGKQQTLVVLFSSDWHGNLMGSSQSGGYARLAHLIASEKKKAEEAGADVLVVAGGDLVGKGSIPCRMSQDKDCMRLVQHMGIDVSMFGNYELNRSPQELSELISLSRIPWLATNVKQATTHEYHFHGKKSGAEVVLLGWISAPVINQKDFQLTKGKLPSEAQWTLWQKEVANKNIIWVTHQEYEEDRQFVKKLCQLNLKSLALLKANDHEVRFEPDHCREFSKSIPLIEVGAFTEKLGKLVFVRDANGNLRFESQTVLNVDSAMPENDKVKSEIDQLYKKAPYARSAIKKIESDIPIENVTLWYANVLRKAGHTDIAIVNRGGVKLGFEMGTLTRDEVYRAIPYNDPMMGLDWNFSDFEKSICKSTQRVKKLPEDYGSELVLSGAKLLNPGTPDCKVELSTRRASVKVGMTSFLVSRSATWLGKDLRSRAFKFGTTSEQAIEASLRQQYFEGL